MSEDDSDFDEDDSKFVEVKRNFGVIDNKVYRDVEIDKSYKHK